jgi:hypothetical protein
MCADSLLAFLIAYEGLTMKNAWAMTKPRGVAESNWPGKMRFM